MSKSAELAGLMRAFLTWKNAESTSSTKCHTPTNNFASTTPLPPFGHLLPMPGEKGIMKEVIGKVDYRRACYLAKLNGNGTR